MTEVRDHQRGRVYAWEERFVASRDSSSIAFAQAQGVVDAIWADMGLRFPPKVMRLPRQARATVADATRLLIRLSDTTSSWCLLHELAHAMSSTHEGQSDGHGPHVHGLVRPAVDPLSTHTFRYPWQVVARCRYRGRHGMRDRSS